jgi:beta-glucanase (GH16 family)
MHITILNLSLIKRALFLMFILWSLVSCQKEDDEAFNADFEYEFIDENRVLFTNTSVGNYQSLIWDFGNEEKHNTNDKNKSFEVFYPKAGDYHVELNIYNDAGENNEIRKTITIENDVLEVSFTAEPDAENQNLYHLTNTTVGDFDSIRWQFRHKNIENTDETVAYLPFKGTYKVELQVTQENVTFSDSQNITIENDDPDYLSNMELVWSDEFDGSSIDQDNWTFETGATGWGNNELQDYTNGDNAEIVDEKLVITARKVNDNKIQGSYTSSRMVTLDKHDFLYGRMEIRAKLPSGTGIWPAIWMLGSNISEVSWPACGEIDIMEYVGYQPNTVHSTVHTPAGYGADGKGNSISLPTAEEEFHNYGIIWTEKFIRFYLNDPENIRFTYSPSNKTEENWPFDKPQFFILNIAVGGDWGGAQGIDNSIFPQKMEVDYVRVYQEIY